MSSPAIRFAGFTDDWEERKIQDLADRHDNLRIPITASNRVSGNTPYYGANGIQDYVEGFTHDGEFILVAEDGANDLQDYPVNYVNFKVWVNNHAHVLQAKQFQADNKFLMNALKHTDIEPYLVGGGRAKLNAGTMMEISFPIPTVAEQSRIGKFFFALDDRITLHQRAHDKTVNIKKALLEKMFPKAGEDKPEIRFAGFSDDWERRRVGEFYFFKNGLNKSKEYFGKGTPIINFTDVFHNRGLKAKQLQGKVLLDDNEIKNFEVRQGDIFFTRTSETIDEIGYPSVMLDTPESTVFSGFVLRGRAIEDDPMTNIFKRYVFFTQTFRSEMIKKSSMTTRALTSGTAIKEMCFNFPVSKKEQEQIGLFFANFDRLIALHQRELTKLQNIKKALLEKMFA